MKLTSWISQLATGLACAVVFHLLAAVPVDAAGGPVVGWGSDSSGQCDVPAPNADFVAIAAGWRHSLGLKADGSIVAWGDNSFGQCNVPVPNPGFVAVGAGYDHSLAITSDHRIIAWGNNNLGQCNVPEPNSAFVAVSGGQSHSLGLKSDGSVVAWGANSSGQCNVPQPNKNFVAVAAGAQHSLGIKSDGTIVAWGWNYYGQCTVPAPNTGFVAIAGGGSHSLGLKLNGTIVAWGSNYSGECDVPSPGTDFVAIAAGRYHSLGVKSDGAIVAWGSDDYEQCEVPEPNGEFVAAAGGRFHTLGLKNSHLPNLIVEACNPDTTVEGPPVTLILTVTNQGTAAAVATKTGVTVDGVVRCEQVDTPPVPPGESVLAYCAFAPLAIGTHEVEILADATDLVTESSEDDNLLAQSLVVLDTADAPEQAREWETALLGVMPNPSAEKTTIRYSLAERSRAWLAIFDVGGRRVRLLADGMEGAGPRSVIWDGRNEAGVRVEGGIYYLRFRSGTRTWTRGIAMLP